jgi:hypothetical protein
VREDVVHLVRKGKKKMKKEKKKAPYLSERGCSPPGEKRKRDARYVGACSIVA